MVGTSLENAPRSPRAGTAFWVGSNNVVLNTPFPGIQIKALAIVGTSEAGVFLSGTRKANVFAIQKQLKEERSNLLKDLPKGTEIRTGHHWPIMLYKDGFKSDRQRRQWLIKTINKFVNVLRPCLRRWYDEAYRL
jgi:hypothetical protein